MFRGGWITCTKQYLGELPIVRIDLKSKRDYALHEQIIGLVHRLIALHADSEKSKTSHAKTVLQRQIDATDRQIDRLVYELYGLSDEEIALVEAAT